MFIARPGLPVLLLRFSKLRLEPRIRRQRIGPGFGILLQFIQEQVQIVLPGFDLRRQFSDGLPLVEIVDGDYEVLLQPGNEGNRLQGVAAEGKEVVARVCSSSLRGAI
jgi:hypothetical protein